jgi:hypothetical protein
VQAGTLNLNDGSSSAGGDKGTTSGFTPLPNTSYINNDDDDVRTSLCVH